jgi:plasmid stability protein
MPTLTIRNLSEEAHRALRLRAAQHGRSTEAEVRMIIENTVRPPERLKLGSEIRRIAAEAGGMDDIQFPRRRTPLRSADFR